MKVNITWVEAGTNNAACVGYDERNVEVESVEQARQDALHFGAEAGIDLCRYEPAVDVADDE